MAIDETIAAILRKIVTTSRARAAKAGMPHSLPDGHAALLYERQNGRCEVTGLAFSMQRFATALVKHPFAPSLDRKDSQGGYTVDNVRLVYICVNFGMGQWGQEVYLHCARAAVEHDRLAIAAPLLPPPSGTETAERRLPDAERDSPTERRSVRMSDWHRSLKDRIDAAEMLARSLDGEALLKQRRHIASLKRNFTLGPEGLSLAGDRAAASKRAAANPQK
jgi:hypothetical protein